MEYEICYQYSDVARSISTEDNLLQSYKKEKDGVEISIREFQVESIEQSMYSVTFERQNVLYRLRGIINREEMEKIVENLFFS